MAEPAVTTQSAPTSAPAAPPATETGTGTSQPGNAGASPVEDYKAKYTELEGRYKSVEEEAKALNTFRQLVARHPELREHLTAAYEGRKWAPKTVEAPAAQSTQPAQPAPPAIPKEFQDKLGAIDQMQAQFQQMQRMQAEQFEGSKLDKEIQETHAQYPILKDPKMAGLLAQRFNERVMEVARGFRQQDQFTPDTELIEAARTQIASVPYRVLAWDLMEKELAQYAAEQAMGRGRMNNPGGRGDRVVSQPAGQSPDADLQFEKEMQAASNGRDVNHTKRAEALMKRGITPRDLGWPD